MAFVYNLLQAVFSCFRYSLISNNLFRDHPPMQYKYVFCLWWCVNLCNIHKYRIRQLQRLRQTLFFDIADVIIYVETSKTELIVLSVELENLRGIIRSHKSKDRPHNVKKGQKDKQSYTQCTKNYTEN
jgi:hypothetical protein